MHDEKKKTGVDKNKNFGCYLKKTFANIRTLCTALNEEFHCDENMMNQGEVFH